MIFCHLGKTWQISYSSIWHIAATVAILSTSYTCLVFFLPPSEPITSLNTTPTSCCKRAIILTPTVCMLLVCFLVDLIQLEAVTGGLRP